MSVFLVHLSHQVRSIDIKALKEYNYTYESGRIIRSAEYDITLGRQENRPFVSLKEVTFPASVEKLGEWTFNAGVENAYFEGDAPTEIGEKPFGESKVTIHYRKGTNGWDNTVLEQWYTLVEE